MARATLRLLVVGSAVVVAVTATPATGPAEAVRPAPSAVRATPVCLADLEPERLAMMFDTEPGGVVGADYQRALALPDGRVLWTFQDAAIRLGPHEITIVHNIAVMQHGSCFTVMYGGTRGAPRPMFFADRTVPYERWFWPLDSAVGADGRVYVYAAEIHERGPAYLTETVPVGTWVAVFDPATDTVVEEIRPPDSSADLYGWSITSDDTWTYLYAHCYRQFGFDIYIFVKAFDRSCSTDITVARVPVGRLFDPLQYWDGTTWQANPTRARPIIDALGRRINANQFEWTGARFVSVNKEGDWWGDTIILAESSSPTGPFDVYDVVRAPVKCGECNSFFASWVPAAAARRTDDSFVVSLSHNRWDGVVSSLYRPTFHRVVAPTYLPRSSTFRMQLPAGTGTAAINVAVVGPHEPGFVTAYPCDAGLPLASNVNHVNEPVVSNLVLARPDASGAVCLYSLSASNLVVDLAGTFAADGFDPVERPLRIADTRTGSPRRRVAAGEMLRVAVPGEAATAALNVIAVDPSAPGYLTVFPCDRERPPTSNLNYGSEPVVSNLVIARPDAAGNICIFSLAEVDVVVDLAGAFPAGAYGALDDAVRLADTRESSPVARPRAGGVVVVDVAGAGGDGHAAVLNVIAVDPSAPGFLTVYPCDVDRPLASNVNFIGVPVVSNLVIARPSATGRVCVYTSSAADIVVDLAGVLASGYDALAAPTRLVDTRIGTGVAGQLGFG